MWFRLPALLFSLLLLTAIGVRGRKLAAAEPPPMACPTGFGRYAVHVEVFEDLRPGRLVIPGNRNPADRYSEPFFAFTRLPTKYSINALPLDRSAPFHLRAQFSRTVAAGDYDFELRARGLAEFSVDGVELLRSKPQLPQKDGVRIAPPPELAPGSTLPAVPPSHQRLTTRLQLKEGRHEFVLTAEIGGKRLAATPGELVVAWGRAGEPLRLLGPDGSPLFEASSWEDTLRENQARRRQVDRERRTAASQQVKAAWERRHAAVQVWSKRRPPIDLPPSAGWGSHPVDRFLGARLSGAGIRPGAEVDDLAFLRRLALDTTGRIPTLDEIASYLRDRASTRRNLAIDRYLASEEWGDHWVSYWQDVLAENPSLLINEPNQTGPFRYWLRQSLADNLPFDRLVTELVEMQGSVDQGAPAGFGQSTKNDSPMAAKAYVVAQAVLGQNLACARCHDAPSHPFLQRDLFAMGGMLAGTALSVPESSTVSFVPGERRPAVKVTLKPGEPVLPSWPFAALSNEAGAEFDPPALPAERLRRRLAASLIAPQNHLFAEVLSNRVWARLMGRGLIEPVDDWTNAKPSHPELLRYLGRYFIEHGYDMKRLARLIFTSRAYQRAAQTPPASSDPDSRLFAGPYERRLTAEQVVDSIYVAAGKRLDSESLTLNTQGNMTLAMRPDYGYPSRAWELVTTSPNLDRRTKALPKAQSVEDTLSAFGWRASRHTPVSARDESLSPMQTLLIANGELTSRVLRLNEDSRWYREAVDASSPSELVGNAMLAVLTREPSTEERRRLEAYLGDGFGSRVSTTRDNSKPMLNATFRERFEDVLWALVNSPEFLQVP